MNGEAEALDYDDLQDEVVRKLRKAKHMVLATSASDRVTARTMSCVSDGLTVYCQTLESYTKCRQIAENPNVALCAGNLQIEGRASIEGHPLSEGNGWFAEVFKAKHPDSFRRYSGLAEEVVLRVEVTRATLWKYGLAGESYRDFLEVADRRAHRERGQV
ncbi:MAG: pyridoxamine 5'-phosphate oxidase family protein [Anaerolineales bacterium]|nr:MAG: pyridoxamine 5'-phosphate oxidase family protein [Anaerolineales bacterium]